MCVEFVKEGRCAHTGTRWGFGVLKMSEADLSTQQVAHAEVVAAEIVPMHFEPQATSFRPTDEFSRPRAERRQALRTIDRHTDGYIAQAHLRPAA